MPCAVLWASTPTPPGSSFECLTEQRVHLLELPSPVRQKGVSVSDEAGSRRGGKSPYKAGDRSRILVEGGKVVAVETDFGLRIVTRTVVVTSGTFLRGLLHVGQSSKPGGRMADTSSSLSENLRQLGFHVGRFKTGTPCRLNGRSIDFSR